MILLLKNGTYFCLPGDSSIIQNKKRLEKFLGRKETGNDSLNCLDVLVYEYGKHNNPVKTSRIDMEAKVVKEVTTHRDKDGDIYKRK